MVRVDSAAVVPAGPAGKSAMTAAKKPEREVDEEVGPHPKDDVLHHRGPAAGYSSFRSLKYSVTSGGGAHASQASTTASRSAFFVTVFSWIRTAG